MDPVFADRVLSEAVKRGNSQAELQAHLDSLDAAGQEQFINEAANAFGIKFTSDSAPSPAGELVSKATDYLPAAGAVVGGMLATPADVVGGPVPTIAGAALGGAAGASARNIVNSFVNPDVAPKNLPQAALSTAGGAAEGALQEAGGQVIGKVVEPAIKTAGSLISKIGPAADAAANKIASRFLGFRANDVLKAGGRERVGEMIQVLKNEGLFKNGVSPEAVAGRVEELAANAGREISDVYTGTIGNEKIANVNTLQDEIARDVRAGLERAKELHPNKLAQLDQVDDMLKRLGDNQGNLTANEAWQLQQDLGSKAFEKGVTNENLSVFQDAWKVLKNHINDGLEALRASGHLPEAPAAIDQLAKANKVYSSALEVGKALEGKLTRSEASGGLRLVRRSVAAASGSMAGGPVGSMAGLAAEEAAHRYGPQVAVKGLSAGATFINRIVSKSPKQLGKFAQPLIDAAARSSSALASTHFMLSQTSEAYRKQLEKIRESEAKVEKP